jgi:predicted dehydrogenase
MLDFGDDTFPVVDGCFTVAAPKSAPRELFGVDGPLVVRRPDAHVKAGQLFLKAAGPALPGWIAPRAAGFQPEDRGELLQRAALVDQLIDCLETGTRPEVEADRACHVLEIMLAATSAVQDGRVVELATAFPTDC